MKFSGFPDSDALAEASTEKDIYAKKQQKRSEEYIMPEDFPQGIALLRGFPRYPDFKTSLQGSCIARHCFENQGLGIAGTCERSLKQLGLQ